MVCPEICSPFISTSSAQRKKRMSNILCPAILITHLYYLSGPELSTPPRLPLQLPGLGKLTSPTCIVSSSHSYSRPHPLLALLPNQIGYPNLQIFAIKISAIGISDFFSISVHYNTTDNTHKHKLTSAHYTLTHALVFDAATLLDDQLHHIAFQKCFCLLSLSIYTCTSFPCNAH